MTVAEEGSFTKAALRLNISQPAVSQHVSELEKTTGVRLFERLHGEVRLSHQGYVFRQHAERILSAYRSASLLFSPQASAIVRIDASDEVYKYLQSAFDLFSQIHPEVEFIRSCGDDSELKFELKAAPKIMGGISATHNIISNLSLCVLPSDRFAETELCAILRGFLSDTIS